jgi:hypothetical protein
LATAVPVRTSSRFAAASAQRFATASNCTPTSSITCCKGSTCAASIPCCKFWRWLRLAIAGAWLRLFKPAMRALWRRLLLLGCLLFYLALTVLIYVQFGLLLNTAYHIGAFLLSYWLLGKLSATTALRST